MEREKEINEIIERLKEFWLKHPQQRLGQLLENYVFTQGERGDNTSVKLFYQTDDETLKILRNIDEAVKRTLKQ